MKRLSLFLLCLVLGACTKPAADPGKPFHGTWVFMEGAKKTEKMAIFAENRFSILDFKDGKVEVTDADNPAFQIDASQTPNHITLVYLDTGLSREGIFELDGDKLKMCIADHEEPRPTTFTASAKTTLMQLERVAAATP